MSQFVYVESLIAEACGVDRKYFKSVRESTLESGRHWDLASNRVVYTLDGVRLALEALGVVDGDGAEATINRVRAAAHVCTLNPTPTAVEKYGGPHTLTYDLESHKTSKRWKNPHMLAAKYQGVQVQVRVKDKKNFRPGMELPCHWVHHDFWKLARKCPRWPGRW